jgi:hypothetical protein
MIYSVLTFHVLYHSFLVPFCHILQQGQNYHLRLLLNTVSAQIVLEGQIRNQPNFMCQERKNFLPGPVKEGKFQLRRNKEFSLNRLRLGCHDPLQCKTIYII